MSTGSQEAAAGLDARCYPACVTARAAKVVCGCMILAMVLKYLRGAVNIDTELQPIADFRKIV
jgi:hypothetical protein